MRLRGVAPAVTALAMVATPLLAPRGAGRRVMSSVVVTGLFTTTAQRAAQRWGGGRAAGAAAAVAVATAAVERVGVHTGWPFGRYHYTSALRPQVAGVPVIVPLAWFAMAVPARETARAALGHRAPVLARLGLGAAALTAWDAFLDPQMVGEGYWEWGQPGAYRSIPARNYLGWFVTGLGVMAVLDALLPPGDEGDRPDASAESRGADPELVAQYGFMAVMETLGFAAFFRDRLVALVGGAAMLPVSAVAAVRLVRGR